MEGTRSGPPPRAASARLLLAASARSRLAAVLTGCAILVAALGALFAGQSTADAFDRAVDSPVITLFAGHRGLALWLAFPGTTIPAIVLSVVIAVACLLTTWAESSTRAGTPRPSPRWRPPLPCC